MLGTESGKFVEGHPASLLADRRAKTQTTPASLFNDILDAIDHGVSNFLLPAVGIGTALYVGWRLERTFALAEADFGDSGAGRIWLWLVRILIPAAIHHGAH